MEGKMTKIIIENSDLSEVGAKQLQNMFNIYFNEEFLVKFKGRKIIFTDD